MNDSPFFRPLRLRSVELRNRFVMAPMTRTRSPGGVPTREVADYYARRAAAEVGLIVTEGTVVDRPGSANHPDIPHFHGPALKGWKTVVDAVHGAGGRLAPQLWHVGNVPPQDRSTKLSAPLESPETMSLADVQSTVQAFGRAAASAKELGFDCVEIHGAHGYLIDQFFWEKSNRREDAYGGSTIAQRSRFAREVVAAVRRAVGPDMAVILRLSQWKQQDFTAKLARTPKEMESWLVPLAEAGVDAFHCSQRRYWEPEFEGSDLNFAGWAKKLTGRATITVGSVGLSGDMISAFKGENSAPQGLEELARRMDRGDFDLVAVGRALLQDPQWVLKIRDGRTGELQVFTAESLGRYY